MRIGSSQFVPTESPVHELNPEDQAIFFHKKCQDLLKQGKKEEALEAANQACDHFPILHKSYAIHDVSSSWLMKDRERAFEVAKTIPHARVRSEAFSAIFYRYFQRGQIIEAEGILDVMLPNEYRDYALRTISIYWASHGNRDLAIEKANMIRNHVLRSDTMNQI